MNEQKENFEEEILELIDNQDKFTRSDLQGIVTALVNNIYTTGKKEGVKETYEFFEEKELFDRIIEIREEILSSTINEIDFKEIITQLEETIEDCLKQRLKTKTNSLNDQCKKIKNNIKELAQAIEIKKEIEYLYGCMQETENRII